MANEDIYLIGITGPTCAGKTTLLTVLQRQLNPPPTVLSFDEYDLLPSGSDAMIRQLTDPTITCWEDPALFDIDQYINDLERLSRGEPITLQTRSRESMAAGETQRVLTPDQLIIVEGIFTLSDPRARALFDLKVFINIDDATMLRRRLARTPAKSTDPWDQRSYILGDMVIGTHRHVMPQLPYADIILNGLRPTEEQAVRLISEIDRRGLR